MENIEASVWKLKRKFEENLPQNIENMHSMNSELFSNMLTRLGINNFENKNLNQNTINTFLKDPLPWI